MHDFIKTEKIYSILELNSTVRQLLKMEFPDSIWVCGEIQDLKASKDKRHIYFSLVQKHPEADEIIAQVNAKIFERYKPQISRSLSQAQLSFELKNDIEVKLKCEVDLYPKGGTFGLIVVDIDPIYTIGKMAQSRSRIIESLRAKGLLERNKLLKISELPLRVGLITAHDSAAYYDFTDELKKSSYGFKVHLYDCYMQGKFLEKSVLAALKFFNHYPIDSLDVIVITRGGGSSADLSYFDNQRIAESIAVSKFPVITALGHQINITIADLVSHTQVKTPTKGAQALIEKVNEFMQRLQDIEKRIALGTEGFVRQKKQTLENLAVKIDSSLPRYFRLHREELLTKKLTMKNSLKSFILTKKSKLKENFKFTRLYLSKLFKNSLDDVKYKQEKVILLDPKNILKRGYSITLKNKKALKFVDNVRERDIIKTLLYKGTFESEVLKTEG